MRNINGYLKNIIGAEFSKIFNVSNETVEKSSFVVEYPKNKSDGELSTNICMVWQKRYQQIRWRQLKLLLNH